MGPKVLGATSLGLETTLRYDLKDGFFSMSTSVGSFGGDPVDRVVLCKTLPEFDSRYVTRGDFSVLLAKLASNDPQLVCVYVLDTAAMFPLNFLPTHVHRTNAQFDIRCHFCLSGT